MTKRQRRQPFDAPQLTALYAARATDPATLRRSLPKLAKTFRKLGQLDLLLDLLLAEGSIGFADVELLLEVYVVANKIGRKPEVTARIHERQAGGGLAALPWRYDFKLARTVPLGAAAAAMIVALKYDGIVADPDDPLAAARAIGRRIVFPAGLLDALFAVSRCAMLGRSRWEEEVRIAFALEHLTSDFQIRATDLIDFPRLLDPEATAQALAPLKDQPLLCVVFHGGYLALAKRVFVDHFPGGMRLQLAPARSRNEISVRDDPRLALFRALDALREGRAVMAAPDAAVGALKGRIPLLGQDLPVPEGTAFLAHETGCRTVWFAIERSGDGFAPVIVEGPRAEAGEPFRAFRERFFAFVGARIEHVLTGDPRNLAFRPLRLVLPPVRDPGETGDGPA